MNEQCLTECPITAKKVMCVFQHAREMIRFFHNKENVSPHANTKTENLFLIIHVYLAAHCQEICSVR